MTWRPIDDDTEVRLLMLVRDADVVPPVLQALQSLFASRARDVVR